MKSQSEEHKRTDARKIAESHQKSKLPATEILSVQPIEPSSHQLSKSRLFPIAEDPVKELRATAVPSVQANPIKRLLTAEERQSEREELALSVLRSLLFREDKSEKIKKILFETVHDGECEGLRKILNSV